MFVLILRSAHAGKLPQTPRARTRVSKDGDERLTSPLMLRDASQRALAGEAPAPTSRCDAPQHEGEGRSALRLWKRLRSPRAATLLSVRAGEAPTCGCAR